MRNATVSVLVLLVGLYLSAGLDWLGVNIGPSQAEAAPSKLVIPAAMGFSGTLLGEVGHNDDGKVLDPKWLFFRIKLLKVVGYDSRNKVKLSPDALTSQWRDNFVSIGPANGAAPLPELAQGDLVLVTGFQVEGHVRQTQVVSFKPGEIELNCYTFIRKNAAGSRVSLVLRKVGQEKTFNVAMEKGADGKMAARADVLTAVDGLQEKSVVLIKLDHNLVTSIKAYEPPEKGEFVKFTSQKSGTKSLPAVELKDASGATQTLAISSADSFELSRAARALKPGAAIEYRSETTDQGKWLTDIHPPL